MNECVYMKQIFFVQDSWALGRLLIVFDPSTLTDISAAQAQSTTKDADPTLAANCYLVSTRQF